MTSVDIRSKLVQALGLDLIGPDRDSELLAEVLPQAPSRWYLTGFLVPVDTDEQDNGDEASSESMDELSDSGGTDDAAIPEPAAARRAILPPPGYGKRPAGYRPPRTGQGQSDGGGN